MFIVHVQDLEETASVGRGSPVQQELEDSETEASIMCHLAILGKGSKTPVTENVRDGFGIFCAENVVFLP